MADTQTGPYVTRVAPSPTGVFHLGTARTAYFNWLAARGSGGRFILRIDDTDAARNDSTRVDLIYEALRWLGLDWDETFCQSGRYARYRDAVADLVLAGLVVTEGGAVRLNVPAAYVPDRWTDTLTGDVVTSPEDREHARRTVLLRADGTPTYHLASVVDDIDHGVNYVIRGQDHVSNTLRQVTLYHALGRRDAVPAYAHVGLIHTGGRKLSKRDGAASLLSYRDAGYSPDAVLNYLLRVGWSPTVDDRASNVIAKADAPAWFLHKGRMRPSAAGFDPAKLAWYDRVYKARKDG